MLHDGLQAETFLLCLTDARVPESGISPFSVKRVFFAAAAIQCDHAPTCLGGTMDRSTHCGLLTLGPFARYRT